MAMGGFLFFQMFQLQTLLDSPVPPSPISPLDDENHDADADGKKASFEAGGSKKPTFAATTKMPATVPVAKVRENNNNNSMWERRLTVCCSLSQRRRSSFRPSNIEGKRR